MTVEGSVYTKKLISLTLNHIFATFLRSAERQNCPFCYETSPITMRGEGIRGTGTEKGYASGERDKPALGRRARKPILRKRFLKFQIKNKMDGVCHWVVLGSALNNHC